MGERPLDEAVALMSGFAERTGLASAKPPRRYLWTDAFAVCNFLALGRATGEARYRELALDTVDRVHHVLGRHRPDEARSGWISGLGEVEGERHPTRGGLRIGKPWPERPPDERFDERSEWERDGQYFHYLTKWMHALDQVARETGEARFNTWARELAGTAHRAFVSASPGGGLRMAWKMSIDLSRPLVPSMGQHDPVDGLVSCVQLQATAAQLPGAPAAPDLRPAALDFAALARGLDWATADPLGLGGLLADACRVAQLASAGALDASGLLHALLGAALRGLPACAAQGFAEEPASRRLAFRELGLAIGLAALEPISELLARGRGFPDPAGLRAQLEALAPYRAMGRAAVAFWTAPEARRDPLWEEHRDINEVMLATCLVPEGFLVLRPVSAGRNAEP